MFTYKMRAECCFDLGRFLTEVQVKSFKAESKLFPGMEATFSSTLDISKIRKIIAAIEDAHVMLETLELEINYTGERK